MSAGNVYWFDGTLYTENGHPIVDCTLAEVLERLQHVSHPLRLLRKPPPTMWR